MKLVKVDHGPGHIYWDLMVNGHLVERFDAKYLAVAAWKEMNKNALLGYRK